MKKKIKIGIAIALVIAVGAGGFLTYRHFKSKAQMAAMMPEASLTERVSRSSFTETITASGSVLLDDEIEVYAEGDENIIKSILVEEGDTVSEGDLLIEYDVDDREEELENQIRDTKREIENAELSLASLTAETSETELAKLAASITSAEKTLQEAQTTYDKYDTQLTQQQNTIDNAQQDVDDAQKEVSDIEVLLTVGGASQSEYDTAVTALNKAQKTLTEAQQTYNDLLKTKENAKLTIQTAKNDLTNAQNEYNDALTPLSTEQEKIQYQQQQLTLQGLKDNLADYEQDLSELVYTTSSTVNGKVTEVCVDEGTYTEENTVVLMVADFDKLIVSASIEEYDAPLLELGQNVIMTSDGLEGKEYTGTITKISDVASSAETTMGSETAVPIEISVDNPDGILKPGYNLDLEITVVDKQDVLTVSSGAVKNDAKEGIEYVYVVENGVLQKREVTTGETDDTATLVEIVSGLSEGDEVISSISDEMSEGMTLEEVKALSESDEAGAAGGNMSKRNSDSQGMMGNMTGGGMSNDQNRGSNQSVPSGGAGGGGFGGGGPMG